MSLQMLRRAYSDNEALHADTYDQAEQGICANLSSVATPPPILNIPRSFSLPISLKSPSSTLINNLRGRNDTNVPLNSPRGSQQQYRHSSSRISGISRCGAHVYRFLMHPFRHKSEDKLEAYRDGYEQFCIDQYDDLPDGWPRTAAFLDSCDSFGIYRIFGHSHSRLLITQMTEITNIEKELAKLDKEDEEGGKATAYRLKSTYHAEGLDTTRRDLQSRLKREILDYDALLLNFQRLKTLDTTPERDHDNVFKWIWQHKPLDTGEYDWIFHHKDFVSLVPPRGNRLEDLVMSYFNAWPTSWIKNLFATKQRKTPKDSTVEFFSTSRIATFARLIVLGFAVSILCIPVFLFLLIPMSKVSMSFIVLAFVFVFSSIVSLLTEAGIQEIFVGTATYCAVLVTFLGNLQNPSNA